MFIVATVDQNWAIGKNGQPLYNIPVDQVYFREIVLGHTVVYGHNSIAFPGYNRPIDGCRNLILSRDSALSYPGATVIHDFAELDKYPSCDIYIAGGESIYWQLYERCEYAILTQVETVVLDSDAFFPRLADLPNWKKLIEGPIHRYQGLPYHFVTYANTAFKT